MKAIVGCFLIATLTVRAGAASVLQPATFDKGVARAFLAAVEAAGTRGVVLDVGANDGTWTRSWATQSRRLALINISLEVIFFEPQPTFRSRLEHVAMQTGFEFVRAAAWKHGGTLQFSSHHAGSTAASISTEQDHDEARGAGKYFHVPSVDLAAFISSRIPPRASNNDTMNDTQRVISLMKLDVESAEYDLLPWLLTHNALCRIDYLLIEWHLNRLPISERLPALGLRLSLPDLLKAGCETPPRLIEHDEPWEANTRVMVPGLHALAMLHAYPLGSLPSHTKQYMAQDKMWLQAAAQEKRARGGADGARDACPHNRPRCASTLSNGPQCYFDDMACDARALEIEIERGQVARQVWVAANRTALHYRLQEDLRG